MLINKKLNKRILALTLSFLSLLVASSSLFIPLNSAYAAPSDDATPENQAKSYIYYRALASCFSNRNFQDGGINDEISAENAAASNWLDTNDGAGIVFDVGVGILNSDNGKAHCGDANLIKSAWTLWGYPDAVTALCDMMKYGGISRQNGDCLTGSGWFDAANSNSDRSTSFKRAIEEKFYGKRGEPTLTKEASYYLHLTTFTMFCKASPLVKVAEATPAQKAIGTGDKGYAIKIVDPTSKAVVEWYYQGGDVGKSDRITTYQNIDQNSYYQPTCAELAQTTSDNVQGFADYLTLHPEAKVPDVGSKAGTNSTASTTPQCDGGALGWIICPVMSLAFSAATTVLGWFDNLLHTSPVFGDTSGPVFAAWNNIRGIANTFLILAFVILIFSQATSIGISSYGAKKMLPRIIASAILINLSFYICSIAVDISNVLGSGAFSLINNAGSGGGANGISAGFTASGIVILSVGALVGVASGIIFALLPIVVGVVLGLVGAVVLLVIRLAFLYVLIAIAPIAFAFMILPGTQKWFEKWKDFFTNLLVFYPIIMGIFGAAFAVAKLLGSPDFIKGFDDTGGKVIIAVLQLALIAAPIFAMPAIFKLAGGVLNRFAGVVNNPSKGLVDRSSKWAAGAKGRQREAEAARGLGIGAVQARRSQKLDLKSGNRKQSAEQRGVARRMGVGRINNGFAQLDNEHQASEILLATSKARLEEQQQTRLTSHGPGGLAASHTRETQAQLALAATKASVDAHKEESLTTNPVLQRLNEERAALGMRSEFAKDQQQRDVASALASGGSLAAMTGNATLAASRGQAVVDSKAAEDLKNAMKQLDTDLTRRTTAAATTPGAPPFNSDNYLKTMATSASTDIERAAALHTLATQGRSAPLREMLAPGSGADPTAVRQAIYANSDKLIAKAPDMIKGPEAAFSSISGGELKSYSADTVQSQFRYLDKLYAQATGSGPTPTTTKDIEAFNTAITQFNAALEDIHKDIGKQGDFKGATGKEIIKQLSSPTSAGYAASLDVSNIQSDGKIR